jgi:hypothetical protein
MAGHMRDPAGVGGHLRRVRHANPLRHVFFEKDPAG